MEGKKYRTRVGNRSPGRPKRLQQEQLSTEAQILHHAGVLFFKSGYAAVSISNIKNVVGITKPTLYHYFPDKEHLYTAVLCERLERIGEEIPKTVEGKHSIRSKLFALAYRFFRSGSLSMSSFIRDVKEHLNPSLIQRTKGTYDCNILVPHINLLQKAMEDGEIRYQIDRLKMLAEVWLGMLDALSLSLLSSPEKEEEEVLETAHFVVSLFLDGVGVKSLES